MINHDGELIDNDLRLVEINPSIKVILETGWSHNKPLVANKEIYITKTDKFGSNLFRISIEEQGTEATLVLFMYANGNYNRLLNETGGYDTLLEKFKTIIINLPSDLKL